MIDTNHVYRSKYFRDREVEVGGMKNLFPIEFYPKALRVAIRYLTDPLARHAASSTGCRQGLYARCTVATRK